MSQVSLNHLSGEMEQLDFPISRWMRLDEDDGDVVREVAARWPDRDTLPGSSTSSLCVVLRFQIFATDFENFLIH